MDVLDRLASPQSGAPWSLSILRHQQDQVDVWSCSVQQGGGAFTFTLRPGSSVFEGPPPVANDGHEEARFQADAAVWVPLARELAVEGFASLIDVEQDVQQSLLEEHATAMGMRDSLALLSDPWRTLGGLFVFTFSHLLSITQAPL